MPRELQIGFGCSGPWGMRWFSEKRAIDLVSKAVDLGVRDFDTGNFYCGGNAEVRLGQALRKVPSEHRHTLRISSKTGTQADNFGRLSKDFTATTMKQDLQASLKRLHIDQLDTLYLHGPDPSQLATALPLLAEFKSSKLIRNIGVCANGTVLQECARHPLVDVIMGTFNVFASESLQAFITAKERSKRTVAIAPLAQAVYRSRFLAPNTLPALWYVARAVVKNPALLKKSREQKWLHEVPGWSATDLMLAWVLSHPFIDIAVTNTTKPANLVANVAASKRQLPSEIHEMIARKVEFA